MSTQLQDMIRKLPPRMLTENLPGGNIMEIRSLGMDDTQVTIGTTTAGLPTYENTPMIDPTEIPIEIVRNEEAPVTVMGYCSNVPANVRSTIIVDWGGFAEPGIFQITTPELKARSETGVELGIFEPQYLCLTLILP